MQRFLFLTWPGAGNQSPAIGVAAELRDRGHSVAFGGYAAQRGRFAEAGYEFLELPGAQRLWPRRPPDWMSVLVDVVWACRAHGGDLDTIRAGRPHDLLVVDCLMYGALAAAEARSLPAAVLVHSSPGALTPPGGGMEQLALGAVNALRAGEGLAGLGRLWDAWRPFPTFCTTVRELDPLATDVPAEFTFVGPVPEPAAPSGWTPPWPADDERPLIAASFSTGPAWEQRSRISRTLRALGGGAYRVLVTTAVADVAGLDVPAAATLVPHVPHAEVLGGAAVLITHGGHGTVAAGLAHGVPMVFLPNPAADQPALAAQVAEHGAGIALDGENATAAQIRAAVGSLLADPEYRVAAARLGSVINTAPGAAGAADLLESLAQPVRW